MMIEFGVANLPDGVRVERSDDGSRSASSPSARWRVSRRVVRATRRMGRDRPGHRGGRRRVPRFRVHPVRPPGRRRAGARLRLPPGAPTCARLRRSVPLLARSAGSTCCSRRSTSPTNRSSRIADGGLAWGWHGDLDEVPAGFATDARDLPRRHSSEAAGAVGARAAAAAGVVRRQARGQRRSSSHLSYWTDNGAAYWYRTEPGPHDRNESWPTASRRCAPTTCRSARSNSTRGSTSTRRARPDRRDRLSRGCAAERDAACGSRGRTRSRRPIASRPPDDDRDRAVRRAARPAAARPPRPPHLARVAVCRPRRVVGRPPRRPTASIRRSSADGSTTPRAGVRACIEQDWMLMYWFGVRALRVGARPGGGVAAGARRAGRATGVDLMWCMATPADLVLAADARSRRRGAHERRLSFRRRPGAAVDLVPHRQPPRRARSGCRRSRTASSRTADAADGADAIDGDDPRRARGAAGGMSAGPVGIGDRIGRTDREIVMRTCDDDGRLRHVDRPLGTDRRLPVRRAGARRATGLGDHVDDPPDRATAVDLDVRARDQHRTDRRTSPTVSTSSTSGSIAHRDPRLAEQERAGGHVDRDRTRGTRLGVVRLLPHRRRHVRGGRHHQVRHRGADARLLTRRASRRLRSRSDPGRFPNRIRPRTVVPRISVGEGVSR